MTKIHEELITKARTAGAQAGSATQMLRDAIRDAYATGARSFGDVIISDMRAAFRDACAAAGKSKNAGNVLFARAWDDLIEEGLALEERGRKGMGKNGGKGKTSSDADASDAEGEEAPTKAAPVDKAAIAREMLEKAGINADLIKLCVAAFAGLEAAAKDKTHKDAAKDARHALKSVGGKLDKLMQVAGAAISREEATAVAADAAAKAQKAPKATKPAKAKATQNAGEARA